MKQCVLLLAFVCVHGAPAGVLPQSSCKDVTTVAEEAIDKINHDRTTGYVFSLEHVSNVHQIQHVSLLVGIFRLYNMLLNTGPHFIPRMSLIVSS